MGRCPERELCSQEWKRDIGLRAPCSSMYFVDVYGIGVANGHPYAYCPRCTVYCDQKNYVPRRGQDYVEIRINYYDHCVFWMSAR